MGNLDAKKFAQAIAGCTKCDAKAFEVQSYIDRQLTTMLAQPNQDGRWTHDDAKFIDGAFRIKCIACSDEAFATEDCPRCHRAGGMADISGKVSRLTAPTLCPSCKGTELTVTAFVPARVRTGEGRPGAPTAVAQYGEPGFHIARVHCGGCDWVAVPEDCPLCAGPGPLRERACATEPIRRT